MKTAIHRSTSALLLAMGGPAMALTPVSGDVSTDLRASVSTEFFMGIPGVEEYRVLSGSPATSFSHESIATGAVFDFNDIIGYGPTGTMAANASASWTKPNRGMVNFQISRDLQGNGNFPSNLSASSTWGYVFQTSGSRALLSGSWNTSGNIAQVSGPNITVRDRLVALPVENPTPNSFSVRLAANTENALFISFSLVGASPGIFDGTGNASTQINWSINAVPEPTSWVMLIAGFGLAGAQLRRRRALDVVGSLQSVA
jgi:hypothetical protein